MNHGYKYTPRKVFFTVLSFVGNPVSVFGIHKYPDLSNLQGSIVSKKCKYIKKTVSHAILLYPRYPDLNNLQGSIVSMKCKDIKKTVPHTILLYPRYPDLNNLQGSIVSMKCKDIKKTVPHAILFNPSSFKGNCQQ